MSYKYRGGEICLGIIEKVLKMTDEEDFDLEKFIKDTPVSKVCSVCKTEKKLSEFNKGGAKYNLSSWCRDCEKLHHKKNSSRIKIQRKEWRTKNKEYTSAYNKEWYDKNLKHDKKRQKEKNLKHYFNLTLEQFEDMVKQQNGECKICEVRLDMGKGTHVDHDHITGGVRGILCHPCNTKLGWYEKNSAKVEEYLSPDIETDVENFLPSWAFLH